VGVHPVVTERPHLRPVTIVRPIFDSAKPIFDSAKSEVLQKETLTAASWL
jgi:hypothetical protein